MSRLQFVALIASSSGSFVLVVLAWMYSNARLSRLEALLDSSNAKHEAGLTQIRSTYDAGMTEIRNRLANIDSHLMTFYTVTGRLEGSH